MHTAHFSSTPLLLYSVCYRAFILIKMKRENIKENQLVLYKEDGAKGLATIINVRKANRGDEKELMYDLKYLVEKENYENICEHSGMTSSFLEVISKEDANILLLSEEYDLDIEIAKLNRERVSILKAKAALNAL